MKIRLFHRGDSIEVDVEKTESGHRVRLDDREFEIRRLSGGADSGTISIDGRHVRYLAGRAAESVRVAIGGELHELEIGAGAARSQAAHGVASPETRSPIPGKVLKVETEVGAVVKPGDSLLILEAMKMENVLVAEVAGTVREIHVAAGDMVDPGKLLVVVEPDEN